jgi:serine/threonine-protein kinase 24/25/MST4
MAQANPHLKSHHRRQQSTPVTRRHGDGDDLTPATAANGASVAAAMMPPPQAAMPQNMPGQIVPGKEHIHHISAVLYGRWVDGLKARWGGLS